MFQEINKFCQEFFCPPFSSLLSHHLDLRSREPSPVACAALTDNLTMNRMRLELLTTIWAPRAGKCAEGFFSLRFLLLPQFGHNLTVAGSEILILFSSLL